jgi:hypothetical protein
LQGTLPSCRLILVSDRNTVVGGRTRAPTDEPFMGGSLRFL